MNELIASGIEVGWHAIKRTFSVIVTIAIIGGIAWLIWVGMIKPHYNPLPTTRQEGTRDNNVWQVQPKSYFGCQHFKIMKEKQEAK